MVPLLTYLTLISLRWLETPALARTKLSISLAALNFFCRLEIYTGITPTTSMRDIIVEIMVEVLTILAIATKEVGET